MKILCCDPSLTAFGWAVIKRGRVLESGCIKTKPTSNKLRIRKSDDRLNRVSFICNTLVEIIDRQSIGYIVAELPHGSQNAAAAISLGLVAGAVQGIADARKIGVEWFSEGESKQYFLGKRSASKGDTISRAQELFGTKWVVKAKSTNEAIADSLSVYYCATQISPTVKVLQQKEM